MSTSIETFSATFFASTAAELVQELKLTQGPIRIARASHTVHAKRTGAERRTDARHLCSETFRATLDWPMQRVNLAEASAMAPEQADNISVAASGPSPICRASSRTRSQCRTAAHP